MKNYHIGDNVGQYTILSKERINSMTYYRCLCAMCGKEELVYSSKLKLGLCTSCRKRTLDMKRATDTSAYDDMVGKTFGHTTVLTAFVKEENGGHFTALNCRCELCGNEFVTRASRVKSMKAQSCANCNRVFGEKAREISSAGGNEGTHIVNLINRKTNKNNSTGVRGVCRTETGLFRAYINFKRKQYSLGNYMKLEEAALARAEAEERIYGDFLDYYKETYPEKWVLIEQKVNNRKNNNIAKK